MDASTTNQPNGERRLQAPITIESVKRKIAEDFGLAVEDLEGRTRSRLVVRPRQAAMYLSKILVPERSYPEIGRRFGGRDHSTVIHACHLIENILGGKSEKEQEFRKEVERLIEYFLAKQRGETEIQLILPFAEAKIFFSLSREPNDSQTKPLVDHATVGNETEQLQFSLRGIADKVSRTTTLIPAGSAVSPKSAQFTNTDIIRAVAGYYDVNPAVLERPTEGTESQYYFRVAERLQQRLSNERECILKGDDDLMKQDVEVLWRKLTSPDYFSLT